MLFASNASLGDDLSPLPTRSANLINSNAGQELINAIHGRLSPAIP